MIRFCLVAALALTACKTPPEPISKPAPPTLSGEFDSEDVEFLSEPTPGGRIWLRGTLTRPRGVGGDRPAVVLVQGSGPMTRDGWMPSDVAGPYAEPVPVLKGLAEGLSRRGFVVLRYDKRTCTARADPSCQYTAEIARAATWDDLVGDAAAAAHHLRGLPGVDGGSLAMVGHSQGATVVLDAQARVVASALVLLSGTFRPIDRVIVDQARWQLSVRAAEMTADELVEGSERLSLLEQGMRSIRRGDVLGERIFMGARVSFWRAWIASTAQTGAMLSDCGGRVLYVGGLDDYNASEADREGYRKALSLISGSQVIMLPGLSHALHRRAGAGALDGAAIEAVSAWLGAE